MSASLAKRQARQARRHRNLCLRQGQGLRRARLQRSSILGKARLTLGSKSFSAAAGAKGDLRFKMTKKQRKAVKAAGKPGAEVTLTGSDGRVLDRG